MRILCHAQHLTGVGHFVRMHLLATGLVAGGHEVHLVDGGVPVPRPATPVEPHLLAIPVLRRVDGEVVGARAARVGVLADAAAAIRPDVVLVDHFPFGKWELTEEVTAVVAAARQAGSGVRVLCSLRDIAPRTRYEDEPGYDARVIARLGELFDGLLVHADPTFSTLDEHFDAATSLPVPLAYTGFIAEPPAVAPAPAGEPYAVLSTGGLGGDAFLAAAVEAFRQRSAMALHVYLAPGADGAGLDGGGVHVHAFSPAFPAMLAGATLSISRAGYNTAAALLRSRVRAVVVPDPRLSDQAPRAERLAAAGLAAVVLAGDDVDALAAAIAGALEGPQPRHTFDLDGVAATRRLVGAGWPGPGS